jgi:hypothetical protein
MPQAQLKKSKTGPKTPAKPYEILPPLTAKRKTQDAARTDASFM